MCYYVIFYRNHVVLCVTMLHCYGNHVLLCVCMLYFYSNHVVPRVTVLYCYCNLVLICVTGNDADSLLSGPDLSGADMLGPLHGAETDCARVKNDVTGYDLDTDHGLRRHVVGSAPSTVSSVGSSSPLSDHLISPGYHPSTKLSPALQGHHTSPCGGTTHHGGLHSDSDKPRIWSLADVATSDSAAVVGAMLAPGGRRSPLATSHPALSASKPHTAFSPLHHSSSSSLGFQPWVAGAGYSPSPGTAGSPPGGGVNTPGLHYGYANMGHVTAMTGCAISATQRQPELPHTPSGVSGCVNSLGGHSAYSSKLTNGFLGESHNYHPSQQQLHEI